MRIGQFCVAGRSSVDKTTFGKGLAWMSIAARNPQRVQVSLADPEIVVVERVGIRAQRNVILGASLQARLRLNHPPGLSASSEHNVLGLELCDQHVRHSMQKENSVHIQSSKEELNICIRDH